LSKLTYEYPIPNPYEQLVTEHYKKFISILASHCADPMPELWCTGMISCFPSMYHARLGNAELVP